MEADLEEVQVAPLAGATAPSERAFQLYGWYLGADGRVISGRFSPPSWDVPAGQGSSEPGGIVKVNVAPTGIQSDVLLRLENSPGGAFSDEVTVKRWSDASQASAAGAVITADHATGLPPNIALLEEKSAEGKCVWGKPVAFVGLAAVGKQTNKPCSVSLFSSDRAVGFQEEAKISDADWNNSSGFGLTGGDLVKLPVTVFIAVTARSANILAGMELTETDELVRNTRAAAAAAANEDLTWAKIVFEANRVGVDIDAQVVTIEPSTPDLAQRVGADPVSCNASRGLSDFDPINPTALAVNKQAISVYYVDWIDYPPEPTHAGARGMQCHHWLLGATGPVIFISYTRRSPTTLAHEIGHALGLKDEEPNLSDINLMYNLAPDGPLGANARSRLTIGQVFRMNVYNDSWTAIRAGKSTRGCIETSPCPQVDLDAR
jgi:hypothetical protein